MREGGGGGREGERERDSPVIEVDQHDKTYGQHYYHADTDCNVHSGSHEIVEGSLSGVKVVMVVDIRVIVSLNGREKHGSLVAHAP